MEGVRAGWSGFGGFDLDIHGARAALDRQIQNGHLFLDAAVEFAVILAPPASGQDDGSGELIEKFANRGSAREGMIEEIQPKFEKCFPGLGFKPGMCQQG
jgi:hypothetical protein